MLPSLLTSVRTLQRPGLPAQSWRCESHGWQSAFQMVQVRCYGRVEGPRRLAAPDWHGAATTANQPAENTMKDSETTTIKEAWSAALGIEDAMPNSFTASHIYTRYQAPFAMHVGGVREGIRSQLGGAQGKAGGRRRSDR